MKLPFGKSRNTRPESEPRGQDVSDEANTILNPTPKSKPGFWKSLDWKLMLALLFPVTLETLDYTVVATAQSRIASVFDALPLQSYIGTAYLLASTVFLPLFASIADIYGRHFGLQLSLLFFLVGSAISTGAENMPMVLVGRGIAGIGAAGLLTLVRTVMSDTASLNQNNIQQSMLFLLYAAGYSVGPAIGGFLVSANFRWVFAINLPCTVLAMVLCFIFLRKRPPVPITSDIEKSQIYRAPMTTTVGTWISKLALIDWVGTFLFVSGGILLLLALNWGPDDNWKTARVIVNLVLGVILIVLCVLWEILLERRSVSPSSPVGAGESGYLRTRYTGVFRARSMIPLELFTSYDMCVVQYGSFVSGIVMFVMFYFVAIFATVVTGLSPALSGIQLLYFAPGLGGGSLLSIRMIATWRQPIYPIVLGSVIMTVGVGLIQMAMQHNVQGQMNGFMAMVGVGVGVNAIPLAIQARFKKPNHIAITNAMINFFRAFGGTVGLAQCFTILDAKVNAYIAKQLLAGGGGTLSPADLGTLAALRAGGGLTSLTSLDGFSSAVQRVVRDAFRDGVRWSFVSLIPWLGVGCVLSVFLSRIEDSDAVVVKERGTPEGTEGAKGDGEGVNVGEGRREETRTETAGDVEASAEVSVR